MKVKRFPAVAERVEAFQSFYRRENKRPLFGFFAASEYPLARYPSFHYLPEDRPLEPQDFSHPSAIEGFLADCDNLYARHEACGGDFIWSSTPFWGIPWLEAILGCPLDANHSTGSIHSEAPPDFSGPACIESFDRNNPWVRLMETYLSALAGRSRGRWPIGTTRLRGVSDLLAALYGVEALVLRMMDEGEEILDASRRLAELLIRFGAFQLDRIPPFHGGVGSFYYHLWAPERTLWIQEDATALLSPDLYSQFIEPQVQRIVRSFPGTIMHQHSKGYVPTESYLGMGMRALELHIDEGGPSAQELFDRHRSILARSPLIVWGRLSDADCEWLFTRLPPQGLAIAAALPAAAAVALSAAAQPGAAAMPVAAAAASKGEADRLWTMYESSR